MKPYIKKHADKLISEWTIKHAQLVNIANQLKLRDKEKFIAVGMLDFYLTQINPQKLAEYKNMKERGLV